jgi:DNA-binding transcriptional regulator YiaG
MRKRNKLNGTAIKYPGVAHRLVHAFGKISSGEVMAPDLRVLGLNPREQRGARKDIAASEKALARIRQCRISKQMKISAQLKAWRNVDDSKNSRGDFTQHEAAAFLGVPPKTYIDWEQGRRGPVGIALQAVKERIKLRPGKTAGRRPGKSNRTKAPPRGSVGTASKKRLSETQKSNKSKQQQCRRNGKAAASTSHA